MPLLVTLLAPEASLISVVSGTSLVFLALLGGWLRVPVERL
jgi:hypothetical protein